MTKSIWALFLAVALLTMALGTFGYQQNGDFFYIFKIAIDWINSIIEWAKGLVKDMWNFFEGVGGFFDGVGEWFNGIFGSHEGYRGGRLLPCISYFFSL